MRKTYLGFVPDRQFRFVLLFRQIRLCWTSDLVRQKSVTEGWPKNNSLISIGSQEMHLEKLHTSTMKKNSKRKFPNDKLKVPFRNS